MRQKLSARVTAAEEGMRLDDWLAGHLASELAQTLSRAAVRRLIIAGALRSNGVVFRRPGASLRLGQRLDVSVDLDRLERRLDSPRVEMTGRDVLFRDDVLLAVRKPPGLAVHATADPARDDLFNRTLRFLGGGYLGLHQRLDRDTSGVVLFTLDERANPALASQFAARQVEKVYHALCAGRPRETARWSVEGSLALTGSGRRARMTSVPGEGQRAKTDFAALEVFREATLVEARPRTGRKHQVRAHLRESGLPILGDDRYGGPFRAGECRVERTMLHALELGFRHPLTGDRLRVVCPYAEDFAAALACLRARA